MTCGVYKKIWLNASKISVLTQKNHIMTTIKHQINEQAHQLKRTGSIPTRVKLGLREQAILDAPSEVEITGIQPPYVTNLQTGKQSFMGLEIVRVDLPSCVEVEG